MAKSSNRVSEANKAKAKQKTDVTDARAARAKRIGDEQEKTAAPARKARDIRNQSLRDEQKKERDAQIDRAERDDAEKKKKTEKPTLLDGRPGAGAGLKPGDLFAPKSNPGAAARVPNQPLQPESLQSHGKGIIYDKDLDNPPYGAGDPDEIDASPSGADPRHIDKSAETKKAERATSRFKQMDPDNPSIGRGGKKDATASPNPIGSSTASKNAVAGGSNPGIEP